MLVVVCAAQSGQTAGCALSPKAGSMSGLSHLHAQLIVSCTPKYAGVIHLWVAPLPRALTVYFCSL